jgi:hypothetical protein
MSGRYKSKLENQYANGSRLRHERHQMAARLDQTNTGDLIKELQGRGFRIFPNARVLDHEFCWIIAKTDMEMGR